MSVCELVVLLVIVLFKVLVLCAVVLSPVVFGLSVAIQVKVEPTLAVNGIFTVPPLQIVAEPALVIAGTGFTVTVAVCEAPVHDPIVGDIV
jgi:hypothetical protein